MCHANRVSLPLRRGMINEEHGRSRQLTVHLPPLAFERARELAAREGVSIGAAVRGLIERGLNTDV